MLTPKLLSMLWCPSCQAGALEAVGEPNGVGSPKEGELQCGACHVSFPIHFGFPMLIPESSLTGDEWGVWRSHLEKLQARRASRIENQGETINRLSMKSKPQRPFAKFVGIESGTVLDIGCGPGKFRRNFDLDRVHYVGLDPMTLPEVSDFDFVQGVAEFIPFREGSFTDVVVLAALDHFRDLDRFLVEARRVLQPGGRLHVLQSVHEVRGPISAIKVLAHEVKDAWEERISDDHGSDVPKHLDEFTTKSLINRLSGAFDVERIERYTATWYSPVKMFSSFVPRSEPPQRIPTAMPATSSTTRSASRATSALTRPSRSR